jgi:hypothetical protein
LHQRLTAEAKASERSLNSEIVYRLKRSLEHKLDGAAGAEIAR